MSKQSTAEIIAEQAHEDAARSLINAYSEAIGDPVTDDDPEAVAAYQVARDAIGYTTATEEQRATVAAMVEAIAARWMQDHEPEQPEPAPTYQRYELEVFLGEPDDYDVDAIEAEATEYDPRTGRTVWAAFGDDLAAIAERHELYTYAPAI